MMITIEYFVQSTLLITNPLVTSFENNQIPYKFANFGLINYHSNNFYKLIFSPISLCNQANMKNYN